MYRVSLMRRLLVPVLAALGGIVGVLLTLGAGTVCVVGANVGFCGLHFVTWKFSVPVAIALSAGVGVVVGGSIGLGIGLVSSRRSRATKRPLEVGDTS